VAIRNGQEVGRKLAPKCPVLDLAAEHDASDARLAVVESRPDAGVNISRSRSFTRSYVLDVIQLFAVPSAEPRIVTPMRLVPSAAEYISASAPVRQPCVSGYSGWFGVVRRGRPTRIRSGRRIPVELGVPDRHDRAPEQVVVFGVPAGDRRVGVDELTHRNHARGLDDVHPMGDRDVLERLVGLIDGVRVPVLEKNDVNVEPMKSRPS
jgi:hypothetical protein